MATRLFLLVLYRLLILGAQLGWALCCLAGLVCVLALSPLFMAWSMFKDDLRTLTSRPH